MIRDIIPTDHEFVARVALAFNRFGPYDSIFVGMMKGEPPPFVAGEVALVVHLNDVGQQTGFIAVEWPRVGDGNVGHIHGVAVDDKFRRQGIATLLLDHVAKIARDRMLSRLECITAETDNPHALNCFKSYGFRTKGYCGSYPNRQRAVKLHLNIT